MDLEPARDLESTPTRPRRRRQRGRKPPVEALFGLLIPMFVLSLVFGRGEPLPGMAVLLLAALAAFLLRGNARTGTNLRAALSQREAQGVAALLIPAMAISGVFGGPVMMCMVVGLAMLGLLLVAGQGGAGGDATPQEQDLAGRNVSPSLPVQTGAEVLPSLDVRDLCRGLPPTLAGEVLVTVEHLETVQVQARQEGQTRRTFDAEQSLRSYLPETVRAWKAQSPDRRDPTELERALEQIRRIPGADEQGGETARRAWETQRRFLESRAEKPKLELE